MRPNPEPDGDFARAVQPVQEWAGAVVGLPVVYDWPDAPARSDSVADGGAVLLHPLAVAIAPAAGPVASHVSSAELTLDLLVTAVGMSAFDAAAVTSDLALAASTESEWRMDTDRVDVATWQALGRPPAPAFILRVPVRRLLERAPAPLVREPLRVGQLTLRTVVGRVVASDGRPLPAARVALADGSGAPATADRRGRFRLPVATVAGRPLALSVAARGASVTIAVDPPPAGAAGDLGDLTVPVPEPA